MPTLQGEPVTSVLSPFALVKTHTTTTDEINSNLGNIITTCKCTALCGTIEVHTSHQMCCSAVVTSYDMTADDNCKCPILNVCIKASAVPHTVYSV